MITLFFLLFSFDASAIERKQPEELSKEEAKDPTKRAARITALNKKLSDRDPHLSIDEIIELLRLERGM